MRHQHLVSFLTEHSKCLTSLTFFGVKTALAAPKKMYLDAYRIYFSVPFRAHIQ